MRRSVPLARRRSTSASARTPWLLAVAVALAACGAPSVPPGLQLAVGTASVAVLRGATADVPVDLTRLGGAADAVDLSVTGLPANVTAAFARATLTGGVLTSTLTITVGAAATEATSALTVTASSGSLTSDAALSLDVTSLTVEGRVLGSRSRPLVGATVRSQDESTFTDATGTFTLTGLAVPYDLVVSSALGNGGLHVYEGMTAAEPLLRPTFALGAAASPTLGTTVSGSLTAGALGADEVVVVCVEGLAVPIYGCDAAQVGDTGYSIGAAWFDGTGVAARLHAFHFTVDADDVPVAYLGYETIAVNLEDGVAALANLDFDPVDSGVLSGTTTKPVALVNADLLVSVRFGPHLSMPLANLDLATSDFQLTVPELTGVTYDVVFAASDATSAAYTWKTGIGLEAGTFSVGPPIELVSPADGATGVELTTPFETAAAGGGARTYVWDTALNGPAIALTTTRTDVTVPNPATGGFAFPAGLAYSWNAVGHGDVDTDTAAAGGYTDFVDLSTAVNEGGPGFDGDRTTAITNTAFDFTFAP